MVSRLLLSISVLLMPSYLKAQTNFIDSTFGNGGKVFHDFAGKNYSSFGILQADDKIIMVGEADANSPFTTNFAIARYTVDGLVDSTFSSDGSDTVDINSYIDRAANVALDDSGKILLVGESYDLNNDYYIGIVRYNTDGTYDNSFGTGGKASHMIGSSVHFPKAVFNRSDGKIIIAGQYLTNTYEAFLLQLLVLIRRLGIQAWYLR